MERRPFAAWLLLREAQDFSGTGHLSPQGQQAVTWLKGKMHGWDPLEVQQFLRKNTDWIGRKFGIGHHDIFQVLDFVHTDLTGSPMA